MSYENEPGKVSSAEIGPTVRDSASTVPTARSFLGQRIRIPLWATVTIAIVCVSILLVSSLVPDPAALVPSAGSSGLKSATSTGGSPPSAFYPYLASPNEYPKPDSATQSYATNVSVPPSRAGCQGPTYINPVNINMVGDGGTLPPNGCQLYAINISESLWAGYEGQVMYAVETDEWVGGPAPAFTLYGVIAATPGPSNYDFERSGPDAWVGILLTRDAANEWGGWGTYEYALVAGASSYGSYCFEMDILPVTNGPGICTNSGPEAQKTAISATPGTSALQVDFASETNLGEPPYSNWQWTFGDGDTASTENPTHTYSTAGVYTISVSVEASSGWITSDSLTIDVVSNTQPALPSLPHLAYTLTGTTPTYMLLEVETGSSNLSELVVDSGNYSASRAGAVYNDTATYHLPILWSAPEVVATFSQPIGADALVASPNGQSIVVAASSGGWTWVFEAASAGPGWRSLTPAAIPGSVEGVALGENGILVATLEQPSSIIATTLSQWHVTNEGYGAPEVTLTTSGQQAAPYWATGVAAGSLGVAVTLAGGGVVDYQSTDNGYDYLATTIGSFEQPTTSSVFNSIGDTRLLDSQAKAGAITAATDQSSIFVLYTSDVSGRTLANVTTSPNGGASWNPTTSYRLALGSVGQPQAAASAAGYVYVTWTDDSQPATSADQSVFLMDGRLIQTPVPLPSTGGPGDLRASQPAVTVDQLMRPLYAWIGQLSPSPPTLDLTGAFLSPKNAASLSNATFQNLTGWDFIPSSTGGSMQSPATTQVDSGYVKLAKAFADPGPCGPSLAQNDTALLYHVETAFPAVFDAPLPACANLSPAESPASNITESGVLGPSTYLSVLDEWIFEGLGVQLDYQGDALASALNVGINPNAASSLLPPVPGMSLPVHSAKVSTVAGTGTATANVTVWPENPTTGWLYSSVSFQPDISNDNLLVCRTVGTTKIYDVFSNVSETIGFGWSVSAEGQTRSFSSSVAAGAEWNLPTSIYLTNLTPNAGISWSTGSFGATYETWQNVSIGSGCSGTSTSKNLGDTSAYIVGYSGTLYTNLSMVPAQPPSVRPGGPNSTFVQISPGSSGEDIAFAWNNTMPASATIDLGSLKASLPNYNLADSHTFTNVAPGNYTATVSTQSRIGTWNSSQEPSVSAGEETFANPLTSNYGCTFPAETNPITITGLPTVTPSPTSNTATVAWTANVQGPSWLQYYELGVGLNWTQTAIANGSSGAYHYTVELHGLAPASLFGVTVWTSYVAIPGCVSYAKSNSTVFLTPGAFPLSETDQPYDSITRMGGGASIMWSLSPGFHSNGVFLSGALFYENLTGSNSRTVIVPIASLVGLTDTANSYVLNLTLPQLNTSYEAWAVLNFSIDWTSPAGATWQGTAEINSSSCTFDYERDTTGDGLTDLEKNLGWTITTTNAQGGTSSATVTANLWRYATNELVGDFVEKEFGLNPGRVDTAGSHMLDTWNLTFNLKPGNGALPGGSDFQISYENTSYNPFASGLQYSPGYTFNSAGPIAQNISNISASPSHGLTSGDGSAWAARALWSYTALQAFVNLSGVQSSDWLRAVEGTWKGIPTLTVWGKLSWGANPLAQSTRDDGIPDGEQPDPLMSEVVQFNITSWWAQVNSSSYEAGPFLTVSSGSGGTGTIYYEGYGPVEAGPNATFSGSYLISVPVLAQSQFAYYNLSINENDSKTSKTLLYPLKIGPTSIDLLSAKATNPILKDQKYSAITGSYQVLRVGEAANTLLWAPANNTTLSVLPWGLKRYTAEPDFDLIVLNLSVAATLSGIAGAEGGWQYSMTLSAGLNNLLIPRGEFLSSPLGQALINNTNESVGRSGSGVTFHPTDWSGRSETSGSNAPGNPNYIWMFSTTTQSQNGSTKGIYGGLPSNPAVESGYESLQVQSVIWVNVSASGYGALTSASAELEDLFGGLVLNASGNLSGNILTVTTELGTLGLPANVLSALANVTLPNSGAYSPPLYQSSSSPSIWQKIGSAIWNTISGVANAVGKLVSVVWNAIQAAAAYIGEAATWLSNHLGIGKLTSQFANGLKTLASAMEWALNTFLRWLATEITGLLSAGLNSATAAFASGLASFEANEASAANGLAWTFGQGKAALGNDTALLMSFISPMLLGGGILGITISVVFTILTPFTLGLGFLFPLLIPILMGAFGLTKTLSLPSSGQTSVGKSVAHQNSAPTTTALTEGDEAAFGVFESPHTASQIQPPSEQTTFDWVGYTVGTMLILTSGILALIVGSIASGVWGPAAGYAGFILSVIALCLVPLSIEQYSDLPSTYSASDASQFRQVQVTDIELTFFAFAGIVLSIGGMFAGGPAFTLGIFGVAIGVLLTVLADDQLWQVQQEIDSS